MVNHNICILQETTQLAILSITIMNNENKYKFANGDMEFVVLVLATTIFF